MKLMLSLMLFLWTSAASAAGDLNSRRFVLVVIVISDSGDVTPIQFQNNTFTTEASCKKAGDKLSQKLSDHKLNGARARPQLVYECLDRGSAV
jgi:hypothetical protein